MKLKMSLSFCHDVIEIVFKRLGCLEKKGQICVINYYIIYYIII